MFLNLYLAKNYLTASKKFCIRILLARIFSWNWKLMATVVKECRMPITVITLKKCINPVTETISKHYKEFLFTSQHLQYLSLSTVYLIYIFLIHSNIISKYYYKILISINRTERSWKHGTQYWSQNLKFHKFYKILRIRQCYVLYIAAMYNKQI